MIALRLLAVLNVLFNYARIIQEMRRRASRALYRRASHALRLATWREKRAGGSAVGVRFYRGVPDSQDDGRWHRFWTLARYRPACTSSRMRLTSMSSR